MNPFQRFFSLIRWLGGIGGALWLSCRGVSSSMGNCWGSCKTRRPGCARGWPSALYARWTFQAAGPVTALAFYPDGRWLAAGTASGALHLWPLMGAHEPRRLQSGDPIRQVAFAPHGRWLAFATSQDLWIWNLTGRPRPPSLESAEGFEVWPLPPMGRSWRSSQEMARSGSGPSRRQRAVACPCSTISRRMDPPAGSSCAAWSKV